MSVCKQVSVKKLSEKEDKRVLTMVCRLDYDI